MPHGYANGKVLPRIDDIPIAWVFVDLIGVLADFNTAMINFMDRPSLLEDEWPLGCSLEDRLGVTKKFLFETTVRESGLLWKKVKPYPWAGALLSGLRAPKVIVSSGLWGTEVVNHMMKWCERHLNGKFSDLIIIQHRHLLAGKEALLIDDNSNNTDRFHGCGGHSLLFPQPWNAEGHTTAIPRGLVLERVLGDIRRRYLCAAIPEAQARDMEYGQLTPEFD